MQCVMPRRIRTEYYRRRRARARELLVLGHLPWVLVVMANLGILVVVMPQVGIR